MSKKPTVQRLPWDFTFTSTDLYLGFQQNAKNSKNQIVKTESTPMFLTIFCMSLQMSGIRKQKLSTTSCHFEISRFRVQKLATDYLHTSKQTLEISVWFSMIKLPRLFMVPVILNQYHAYQTRLTDSESFKIISYIST